MLVAEDEEPFRSALCDLVWSEPGLGLVGAACDADEAIALARDAQPDVALLDVRMPGGGGPRAARRIADVAPCTAILALSAHEDRATVLEMLRSGAVGYLVKGVSLNEIVEAIHRAHRGHASLSAATAAGVVADLSPGLREQPEPGAALHADDETARTLRDVARNAVGGGAGAAAGDRASNGGARHGRVALADARREERPRRTDDHFAALLEAAPDGVVVVGPDGRIALVNGQTEELFGHSREELVGESVEILLPTRHQARHVEQRADYDAHPRTRPMGVGLDLAGRRKDGTELPVDVSLSSIETDEGRLTIAFVRDVTAQRAHADLQRRLAEQRAILARLVSVGEEERQRIAGDIHDDSLQAITAAGMRLQMLRRELQDPMHVALLDDLEETVRLSIARLRHLLFDLRPPGLAQEGLASALRMYVEQARREAPIVYRVDDRLGSEPPGDGPLVLFRIAQEALTNIRKHARATRVVIALDDHAGGKLVRIEDDGVGFVVAGSAPVPGHIGLVAMRERAELAGGWLRIDSAPGAGTSVEFWIPDLADTPAADGRNGVSP